jgi:hypothetical protein
MLEILKRAASGRAWRTTLRWGLCAAAAVCGWALQPGSARADTTIAADLDLNVPIDSSFDAGGGFGIRLGQELHLPFIVLNPEIGFTYATLSDRSPTIYRGIAGARVGFGELIRFGVLAHVGFGHLSQDVPLIPDDRDPSYVAFTFDGGLFLDFTALPLLNIGVHAIFNRLSASEDDELNVRYEAVNWMQLGAHVALVF